ncbi:hypothetical protein GCM10011490_24510 [Pseudoclavibacter endophyticus]|uniref:Helix-turn-helix domain-containing protein n=1 Tax=Pseudoclavibacter endophyticus TaxID=1778590 RepID=A0A6H9WJH4_9MICO|nr:helix-turn-helix domain-containing protein [Pseudoclavibacter endophyticus]KAB1647789.1 helix-turn-helix domain-containing protein [Pseudoclavibacter endophyticus]GGA72832.1 hypothetical protein GCM10011490_24510 [Pseudoclavibacter endophyticus]
MARLTVREAADIARRHPDTILKALQRGELPGIQRVRAGRWLVEDEALEAWVNGVPQQQTTLRRLHDHRRG